MIDLVELLRGLPDFESRIFYCEIVGKCKIKFVDEDDTYPIQVLADTLPITDLTKYGTYYPIESAPDSNCILWPSKDNRDWSTLGLHKIFEPYEQVLISEDGGYVADLYSHYDKELNQHVTTSGRRRPDRSILPYKGNEDKLKW